ncbi:MAG: amidohydrolase family protein [Parashewanella sp.]
MLVNKTCFQRGLALSLFGLLSVSTQASDIVPAPKQAQAIVFQNATLHTVTNGVIDKGQLRIEHGKITAIGNQINIDNAKVIDLQGKHVYPGLIALDTSLGLVEIGAVRESVDKYEIGTVNPQLNTKTAYNADSEIIPTVRFNGITYAQVVPSGSGIAGQSVLVNMDAWNINDALYPSELQMHLYWPKIRWKSSDPKRYKKQLQQLRNQIATIDSAFEDGYRYYLADKAGQTPTGKRALASMIPLYQAKGQLFVHCETQADIEQAIALARQYKFKLVIVGGYDAWRVASELNEINAKVIYTHTFGLPMRADEPVDQAFKIPKLLKESGVQFALGYTDDANSRNLAFSAGQAAAYGLSKQQALQSITLDAARILNITDLGALQTGYKASLIISKGDILDPMTSKIEQVYIEGRKVDLNNRQNQLYQKYLKR